MAFSFPALPTIPKLFIWVIALYIVVLALVGIIASWQGYQLLTHAKKNDYLSLSSTASKAHVSITTLNWLSLGLIPDLQFAQQTTHLLASNRPLFFWLSQLQANPFQITESPLAPQSIEVVIAQLTQLSTECSKTWFIQKMNHHSLCAILTKSSQLGKATLPIIQTHLEEPKTYIILFQNSEELRASGGFMGSFARVTVGAQGLSELSIQDIYEPDGQFQGFVPAPPGVAEYLSSGNGLRLPDANWAADFPTAAQTILSYFSLGKEQDIDGIIALNSSLIEKLLTITGDIYLPDYQTNISATTFTTLARADRDSFFPGSKQKQHFLTSFMTQLKIRLGELSPAQRQALLELLAASTSSKDILAFSTDPALQTILANYHLTGELTNPPTTDYLYLLESNVGINKANKGITRQVAVSRENYRQTTTITFTNQNPTLPPATSADANLDYFNYQRLIVPTSWQVESITAANQPVQTWHEQIISNSQRSQFKQVGYLVSVPTGSSTTTNISFTTPAVIAAGAAPSSDYSLTLVKQPGLPATPYRVTWQGQHQTVLLDQDSQLHFKL